MPKVTQMLDAGWRVLIEKNSLRSYTAEAVHDNQSLVDAANEKLTAGLIAAGWTQEQITEYEMLDEPGSITTDDFTPEQALTRLAYKVHGEILDSGNRPPID
jgi:hypothetical protein